MAVYTPLQGTEIDLSSQALVNQFTQLFGYYEDGVTEDGIYNYLRSSLLSLIETSGAASATARLGNPTVLDYAGFAYGGSTSGITPTRFYPDAPLVNRTRTSFITYNIMPFPPFPPTNTTFNITMSQQGLTASVSCQNRTGQLNATSDPPFKRLATPAEVFYGNEPSKSTYTALSFSSACGGETRISYSYLTNSNNTVIALPCPQNNTFTVIIDSQGRYQDMGTIVCSVSPQIQNMTSYYDWQYVYTEADLAYAPMNAPMNSTAFYWGLVEGIMYEQGPMRNAIGDMMESIYYYQIADEPLDYAVLWEAYIRGIVEFVGTVMKDIIASNDGPLKGQVPLDMIKSTNGTAITTTIGWQYKKLSSFTVLIPSTFFAIASILIVLFTQFRTRGVPVQHVAFDPSNPLALMAAASAGGMGNTFDGLTKEHVKQGQKNKVKLGQVGGKIGFVQVNTMSAA
ncbi:hypothetical protein MSAN_00823500 [Mycena sanguinolenta]|uniref:Uncharacterized protein n=1 Tax=Mycena sanguinolenta TaxID=230812 RepID=A0A8H7DCA2_9AGAR|nr:hypothetical protein MSAN_00823500 [Mycena sanguinolenta]